MLNDDQLTAGIRAGDESIFSYVVHRDAAALHAYAYRYVQSADVARDVVQDVFTRLWDKRSSLEVRSTLRQYLFIATRLRALELLRRSKTEQQKVSSADWISEEAPIDEHIERVERFTQVIDVVRELPPRQQEIIHLRWARGLTNPAVAQKLGISVKGVEIQLTRALATLRVRLKGK